MNKGTNEKKAHTHIRADEWLNDCMNRMNEPKLSFQWEIRYLMCTCVCVVVSVRVVKTIYKIPLVRRRNTKRTKRMKINVVAAHCSERVTILLFWVHEGTRANNNNNKTYNTLDDSKANGHTDGQRTRESDTHTICRMKLYIRCWCDEVRVTE